MSLHAEEARQAWQDNCAFSIRGRSTTSRPIDAYLLSLSRYVHLNPVKIAGVKEKTLEERIAHLRAYPWSSDPAYLGEGARNEFADYGPMQVLTGSEKRYRAFVESAIRIREDDEAFHLGLGTGVAVSCQLRHLNDLLDAEPAFRKRVEKLTPRLSKGKP